MEGSGAMKDSFFTAAWFCAVLTLFSLASPTAQVSAQEEGLEPVGGPYLTHHSIEMNGETVEYDATVGSKSS